MAPTNAPAGGEGAVAAFKNALTTGQTALATAQAQAKQAAGTAGKGFAAATDLAVKVSKAKWVEASMPDSGIALTGAVSKER